MTQKPTNADVLAVLVRARALVAQGWCQDAFARDADGKGVHEYSEKACSWCAEGAVFRAAVELYPSTYVGWKAIWRLELRIPFGLMTWNDVSSRTKAQVLDVFDRVIEHFPMEATS